MKNLLWIAIASIIMVFTAQFSNANPLGMKSDEVIWSLGGAAGGAVLGQMIGKDTTSTIIGTAVGGGLGWLIRHEMNRGRTQPANYPQQNQPAQSGPEWVNPDLRQSSNTSLTIENPMIQKALEKVPSNQMVEFQASGSNVSVTPFPAYTRNGNQICRDAMLLVNGSEVGQFTGCRTSQGRWVRGSKI